MFLIISYIIISENSVKGRLSWDSSYNKSLFSIGFFKKFGMMKQRKRKNGVKLTVHVRSRL